MTLLVKRDFGNGAILTSIPSYTLECQIP